MANPSDKIAGGEAAEAGRNEGQGKPLPRLMSDDAAEAFVEFADLSSYDLSAFARARFEVPGEKAR